MALPPLTWSGWPLVTACVTIAGGGIVTYFVTRATARQALGDEREKARQAAGFEKRVQWYESAIMHADETLRTLASTRTLISAAPTVEELRIALVNLKARVDSGHSIWMAANLYASSAGVAKVHEFLSYPEGTLVLDPRDPAVGARVADYERVLRACWSALVVESRSSLGYEALPAIALTTSPNAPHGSDERPPA